MNQININWKQLSFFDILELIPDELSAFRFAESIGLIDTTTKCECGQNMNVHKKAQQKFGKQFQCSQSNSICSKTKSILTNSWFSNMKLSIQVGFYSIAGYCAELNQNQFSFYTRIKSSKSVVNWRKFFRNFTEHEVNILESTKIGGIGTTVEIDETLLIKRKNNTGRMLSSEIEKRWVFGGCCRETGEAFICFVTNRNAYTLIEKLKEHVNSGTRIISDSWRAYTNLGSEGYIHEMVNHSYNFINPNDPSVHTQGIERMWRTLKSIIPKASPVEDRASYLTEYIWKRRVNWYKLTIGERIKTMLEALKNIKFQ